MSEGRDKINKRLKMFMILWVLNTITLITVLWGGSYLIHIGFKWIEDPRDFTLVSCSILKFVFTLGSAIYMTADDKSSGVVHRDWG